MRKSRALYVSLGIIVCCMFFGFSAFAQSGTGKPEEQPLDDIVAIVNDQVVTRTELNQAIAATKMQIAQSKRNSPSDELLIKQVLDQLINKKLQLDVAKQSGLETTNAELDSTIARIAKDNNVSVKTLYSRINYEGLSTESYRNEIRDQLTLQKLQRKEILPRVNLTPKEVDSFLQAHSLKDSGSKEYWLEDILVPLPEAPTSQELTEARQHATSIITKLQDGKNFHQIAREESTDKHALQGGDLGWRSLAEIPSAFTSEIIKLKAKEIAGPIRTSNGLHVIRLAGLRSTANKGQSLDRKQVEQQLFQSKFEEEAQNWMSKLRSQAFIMTNLTY